MSETATKSIWLKPWNGWRGFVVWFAVVAGAAFVLILCLSLLGDTRASMVDVVFHSLLFALGLAMGAMLATLFLHWLCRWRNLRRFLFAAACLITVILLFFTEENWRGRRAWQNYRSAAEAKGEKFSLASLAPPPVADEKNFALTPLLKAALDFDYTTTGAVWRDTNGLAHLQQIRADLPPQSGKKLDLGNLEKGTFTDLEDCRDFYRGNSNYPQPTAPGTAAADILVALGKFDGELKELREAAATRPESRFPIEYNYEPAVALLLPHLAHLRGIARLVEMRAIARLELGQSDQAFEDLKLGLRLSDSVRDEPLLIDHMVRVAILSLDLQIVREGLVRHAWSDAQLAELEKYLGSLDLLAEFELGMGGERACIIGGLEYYHRHGGVGNAFDLTGPEGSPKRPFMATALNRLVGGFYYQNILTIARMHDQYTMPLADEKAHRVYPETGERLDQELEALHQHAFLHPYKVFAAIVFPALSKAATRSGSAQTQTDAARVACALERFRLANGRLPEHLEALVPRFIDAIPTDVIDGQPLRYHLNADGGYVIYSIGWNRVDDGGKPFVVDRKEGSGVDSTQGDWVWQMPGK